MHDASIIGSKKNLSVVTFLYRYGLYLMFVALVAVFGAAAPNFLNSQNLINLIQQSSSMGIACVGMAFVMITGNIDASAGSIMFFSAITAVTFVDMGANVTQAVLITIACGALLGAVNGFLVAYLNVVPFMGTLAMQFVLRGLGLVISNYNYKTFSGEVSAALVQTRVFGVLPIIAAIFLLLLFIGNFILNNTAYGRELYAIGNNKNAAWKSGINIKRSVLLAYVICGALAGVSGLLGSAQSGVVVTTFGAGKEFLVICATVLGGVSLSGGRGKLFPGVMVGVLLYNVIENGLVFMNADPYSYDIIRGMVIFLAVAMDSIRYNGELR